MIPHHDFDENLYNLLKQTCQNMSKEMDTDTKVDTLIKDDTLKEIATLIPTSLDYLTQVTNLNIDLANPLLATIKKYLSDNHTSTSLDVPVNINPCKTTDKVYIVQQIDRKVDLAEIAAYKHMSMEELLDDIEAIYCMGLKLNLNYYVNSILTAEEQQEIQHVLTQVPEDKLYHAYKALNGSYTKVDIRIMYIKMLFEKSKQGK